MQLECVVAAGNLIGERPLWCDRSRKLWWTDLYGPSIHSFDPADGSTASHRLEGRSLGNATLASAEGTAFVLAQEDGLYLWRPGEPRCFVLSPEPRAPEIRLNDGVCDRQGRLWLGSMRDVPERPADGALWCVEPNGRATRHLEGIVIPNGLAASPDGKLLYFADSLAQIIWVFDCDPGEPRLSNRRVFADLRGMPGKPDGSAVDAEGFLWNAEFAGGRVVRYAPDGSVDRVVELPVTHATCVGFGGETLDQLYIATASIGLSEEARAAEPLAGGLFRMDPGVRGLPETRFAAPSPG